MSKYLPELLDLAGYLVCTSLLSVGVVGVVGVVILAVGLIGAELYLSFQGVKAVFF